MNGNNYYGMQIDVTPSIQPLSPRAPEGTERTIGTDKDGNPIHNAYYPGLPNPFVRDPATGSVSTRDKLLYSVGYFYYAKARLTVGELVFPIPPRDARGKRIEVDADKQPTLEDNAVDIDIPGWVYAARGYTADRTESMWHGGRANIIPQPKASDAS